MPPLYFATVGGICYWRLLPLWGVVLGLLPLLGFGVHFLVFKGALGQIHNGKLVMRVIPCQSDWERQTIE